MGCSLAGGGGGAGGRDGVLRSGGSSAMGTSLCAAPRRAHRTGPGAVRRSPNDASSYRIVGALTTSTPQSGVQCRMRANSAVCGHGAGAWDGRPRRLSEWLEKAASPPRAEPGKSANRATAATRFRRRRRAERSPVCAPDASDRRAFAPRLPADPRFPSRAALPERAATKACPRGKRGARRACRNDWLELLPARPRRESRQVSRRNQPELPAREPCREHAA